MQEMRALTTTCYTFASRPQYLRLCPWPQFHQMLHLHILFAHGASLGRLFLILPSVFDNVVWIVCCIPIHLGGFPLWSDTPVTPSHTFEIQDTMKWKKKKIKNDVVRNSTTTLKRAQAIRKKMPKRPTRPFKCVGEWPAVPLLCPVRTAAYGQAVVRGRRMRMPRLHRPIGRHHGRPYARAQPRPRPSTLSAKCLQHLKFITLLARKREKFVVHEPKSKIMKYKED